MDNKLSELSKPAAWVLHARGGDVPTLDECYVANAEGMENIRSSPLYSQEYVSALLAELEASHKREDNYLQRWTDELSNLQEAGKRMAELEAKLNHYMAVEHARASFDQTADIIKRADDAELEASELRAKLATPVRLPNKHDDEFWFGSTFQVAKFDRAVDRAISAAGFKVEGDE